MATGASPITELLTDAAAGRGDAAERLAPLIYDELRQLAGAFMRQERSGHTLEPTALANEAYLRLVDQSRTEWKSRAHFFAVASEVIRRILVDHARARNTAKRGGSKRRLDDAALAVCSDGDGFPKPISDTRLDLLELDGALLELARLNPRHARLIELRFFGGLTVEETAEVLGVCADTVKVDWRTARAWLRARLSR